MFTFFIKTASHFILSSTFCLLLSTFYFLPSAVWAESIIHFDPTITIQKDGYIRVQEKIEYNFGNLEKHGIYRTIPFVKKNAKGKKFKLDISLQSITNEVGKNYSYTTLWVGNSIQYKIGSKYTTLSGVHTYVITYLVGGAITYFKDHDELYWNATGNEWPVPIENSTTTLFFPPEIAGDKVKLACYTGSSGSAAQNCTAQSAESGTAITLSQPLSSYEGITFASSFPAGIITKLEPKKYIPFSETLLGKILVFLVVLCLILAVLFWYIIYPIWIPIKWFLYGRDPNVGIATTAWFSPPQTNSKRNLSPGETGTLVDEKVDTRDVMATIIDLAFRGFIKIEERKKDDFYIVRKTTTKKDYSLQPFETRLIQGLFQDNPSELRIKNADLYSTVKEVTDMLYASMVSEKFFPKNPQSTRNFYIAIMSLSVFTMNFQLLLVCVLFGLNMARKTIDGARAAKVAEGLKNFLTSQDKQLNYQGEKQLLFEKLLSFAVAFGVEKSWAKRFEQFKLVNPDWYSSYDNRTFNSLYLADRLGSSLNSFSGSSAPPVSSSSGFSSGFSGGSSGGGGGGGGGGSW